MRLFVPVVCLSVFASTLASLGTGAEAATCLPATSLLTRTPVVRNLPGGAVMRTWDTGPTTDPVASQRAVVVRIPAGSTLRAFVATTGALTKSATVATYAARTAHPIVTVNGSVFDAAAGAIPIQSVQQAGKPLKGSSLLEGVVAIGPDRKPVMDRVHLTGSATGNGHAWAVTGLNWGSVTGTGVNVYTTSWGTARRPYGTVDVVVASGKVVAVRGGTSRGVAPTTGQIVLTANGTVGTALAGLRVGQPASAAYRLVSEAGRSITDAIGRGRRYLLGSLVDGGDCNTRDEQLRPRSALGWMPNGDLLVVTFSGRAVINGVMFGGSNVHAMPTYLRQLGADRAVGLDGGGSTTLYVRSSSTTSAYRVDRMSTTLRAVPNALTWF